MNRNWALWMVMVGVMIMRLGLVTKGHFHLQDELRYRYTWALIREIGQGDFGEALGQLFQFPLYARPLLVIANLPPALVQVGLFLITGIKTETPLSLTIPSVWQVLVSLVGVWWLYQLGRRYIKSDFWALVLIMVYSLLINANLYLRHVFAYEVALTGYWGLLYWSKGPGLSGIMAGLLYLIYPAYYPLAITVGMVITFVKKGGWIKRGLRYGLGLGSVLGMTEILSRVSQRSFLADSKFLFNDVITGDAGETLVFLYKYLLGAEGLVGYALAVGVGIFLLGWWLNYKHYGREFNVLAIGMVGTYLTYAIGGMLSGRVFYGRMIHMWMWFVALIVIMAIKRLNRGMGIGLVILGLISFVGWYPQYLKLEYPNDVLYRICGVECKQIVSVYSENFPQGSKENFPVAQPQYVGVNFTREFSPVNAPTYDYSPKAGELIFQAPHPINFIAYQYEGYTPEERKLVKQKNYQMKLYKLQ